MIFIPNLINFRHAVLTLLGVRYTNIMQPFACLSFHNNEGILTQPTLPEPQHWHNEYLRQKWHAARHCSPPLTKCAATTIKSASQRQVSRFLESSDLALTPGAPMPTLDPTIKQRLLQHLDTCVAELDLDFGLSSSAESNKDTVKAEADSEARPDSSTTGGDENNNGNTVACTLWYWMVKTNSWIQNLQNW